VRSRLVTAVVVAVLGALAFSATALGSDNGEGLIGETDDRIVTFFSLGVLLFFPLVALIGTVLQTRLERRREEKHEAAHRRRALPDQ
jgi:hypothetical protein